MVHAHTNRKDDIFMKGDLCKTLHLYWSGVKGLVHWRSTHGTGNIPGIFSLHAAYSALRHFFYLSTSSSGKVVQWDARKLGHWSIGIPGHWDTLTLGHRDTGTPVYWDIGTLGQRNTRINGWIWGAHLPQPQPCDFFWSWTKLSNIVLLGLHLLLYSKWPFWFQGFNAETQLNHKST